MRKLLSLPILLFLTACFGDNPFYPFVTSTPAPLFFVEERDSGLVLLRLNQQRNFVINDVRLSGRLEKVENCIYVVMDNNHYLSVIWLNSVTINEIGENIEFSHPSWRSSAQIGSQIEFNGTGFADDTHWGTMINSQCNPPYLVIGEIYPLNHN
ncbi:MAG TPA: hypothetical protein VLL52_06115 [Anaerolineae bacterium]|nr:hypothetical protein [Anaerolineae bacterium]